MLLKRLDTYEKARYLPLINPCIWFRDVLIMHAGICRLDCTEKNRRLLYLDSQSPYIIFQAHCLALHALPYVILYPSHTFSTIRMTVLTFIFGSDCNIPICRFPMRVEVNWRCFVISSCSAQLCEPTIFVIFHFLVIFYVIAQTLHGHWSLSHTIA